MQNNNLNRKNIVYRYAMKGRIWNFFILTVPFSVCFMLLIYAPLELLFGNQLEFNYNMYELLAYMIPVLLAFFIILAALLLWLKKKVQKVYFAALPVILGVLLASYLQGSFFSGNLPPLDGRTIQWEDYASQRWISIALYGVIIIAFIVLWKKLEKSKSEKLAAVLSFVLVLIMGLSLLLSCVMSGGYHRNKVIVHSDSGLLDMADKQPNLVIFLMDAVDGESFQEVMQYHPEYESVFEDFTFFSNVTSGYPYTSRSIPFILSGYWYENDESYESYCRKSFEESPLFQGLNRKGYRMGMYDPEFSFITSLDGKFENISGKSSLVYPFRFIQMQLKMAGYRYFPYDLKKMCYMTPEEIYLASVKSNGEDQYYSMDNMEFLERLKEKQVVYSDAPCFRYIYIRGAHEPFIYEAQSEYIKDSSYESSIELCATIADTYLQKLKEADVYDNTAIIILADHGYADDNASFGRQNPFLLVKGIGEKHAFTISDISVSHEELQGVYSNLLEGMKADEAVTEFSGERRYMFFEYGEENHMVEYRIVGHADNEAEMIATGRVFDYNG